MNGRQLGIAVLNFLLFALATVGLAQFQSVIWYQFFGWMPSPALWLLPIMYLSQTRNWFTGLCQVYALCVLVATVTVMPLGLLMAACGLVFVTTMSFKGRIFWEGMGFDLLITTIAVLSFNLYTLILSWIFEPNAITRPDLLFWIGQIILTSAMSPLFNLLFHWFDTVTGQIIAPDAQMQVTSS